MKKTQILLILLSILILSCSTDKTENSKEHYIDNQSDVIIFPDNKEYQINFDSKNNLINDNNYNDFLIKWDELSMENDIALVYNGKNEPYEVIFINDENNKSFTANKNSTSSITEGKVTFYDRDDFSTSGNNYSTFWLTSSVNYYNKKFKSIYRTYNNNIGTNGTTNLKSKVSSIKMEGQSKVQFIYYSPCGALGSLVFRNNASLPNPLATKKYIKMKDIRLLQCGFFNRLNADNRSYRAIVSYGL